MKFSNIIPAIPGTTVIHYNGFHDSTQEEPVLFWGVCHEDGDSIPAVLPFTFSAEHGQATPLYIPAGGKEDRESAIVAFNVPGWGRLSAMDDSFVYGAFIRQVRGYAPYLGAKGGGTVKAAIEQLEISLETLVTNEPINRAEGNTEQADLEAENASEIRQALAVLKAADAGPIWPEPKA